MSKLEFLALIAALVALVLAPVLIINATRQVAPPPRPAGPVAEGYETTLVAVTPDGVKLYCVQGPKLIVPTVMAVSPDGKVSLR